jgi:hypothetical protein
MELGAVDAEDAIQLPRAEIPLELQKNFTGLRNVPLFYAQYCRKLNHKNKVQNRVLIATLDHLYCCHPNGDILRCFPFSFIEKLYHDPERKQIGMVVPKEYDLLVALLDTFHFVHVIYSLRSLHASESPLVVELVKRSKLKRPSLRSTSSGAGNEEDLELQRKMDLKMLDQNAGKPSQSLFNKILSKIIKRPPPGVIIGWNDNFVSAEDDGSGENVVGSESEVCIGKGYYELRLEKPEGFQLNLYNVSTDGI